MTIAAYALAGIGVVVLAVVWATLDLQKEHDRMEAWRQSRDARKRRSA